MKSSSFAVAFKIYLLVFALSLCLFTVDRNLTKIQSSRLKQENLGVVENSKLLNIETLDTYNNNPLILLYIGFDVSSAYQDSYPYLDFITKSNFLWDTSTEQYYLQKRGKRSGEFFLEAFEIIASGFTKDARLIMLFSSPLSFVTQCNDLIRSKAFNRKLYINVKSLYLKMYNVQDDKEIVKFLHAKQKPICQLSYFLLYKVGTSFKEAVVLPVQSNQKNKMQTEHFLDWADLLQSTPYNLYRSIWNSALQLKFLRKKDLLQLKFLDSMEQKLSCTETICCMKRDILKTTSNEKFMDWKNVLQSKRLNFTYNLPKTNIEARKKNFSENILSTIDINVLCKPNTIIIGAQKGSTGELAHWLGYHDSVYRYPGEAHFFDNLSPCEIELSSRRHFSILSQYTQNNISNLGRIYSEKFQEKIYTPIRFHQACESENIRTSTDITLSYLLKLHKKTQQTHSRHLKRSEILNLKVVLEKTPAYFDKAVPEIIASQDINNIIVILRNPVDRLHSAFWHLCRRFPERKCSKDDFRNWVVTSFKALETYREKINRGDENDLKTMSFDIQGVRSLAYGLYNIYLQDWITQAKKNNQKLIVLFSENFKENPFDTLEFVEKNLGIRLKEYKNFATFSKGFWLINPKVSKATTESKPKGYTSLSTNKELQEFLRSFYEKSKIDLKLLLERNKDIISYDNFPEWLLT